MSLASPQNPSGVALPPGTIGDILAVMAEKCPDARLLVDETYREAAYGDDPVAASAISTGSNKVISIASLSKCHGAPGLRIGWAVTRDAALRDELVVGKFNTVISCSPVDEALALRVIEARENVLVDRRHHLAKGLQATAEWVQRNGSFLEWVRPDAGALCCVRLKRAAFDEAAVAAFCEGLADTGVRVANGAWFGDEARVFRLGFGFLPVPELQDALQGITAVLEQTARRAA